jgi:homocysteine S-methyltransferase
MDQVRILLDGATGTELERRGARMDAPLWSAHALLERPALVREVHRDYLRAGAQVLTTDTFRTHARNLAAAGLQGRAAELTARAVGLARAAVDEHLAEHPGDVVRVAGSISPLEDCFRPADSPGGRAGPEHRAIAAQLAEAGADLLLVETMGRVDEAAAAVAAAQGLGRPVWLAVVARADGRLLAGESFAELLAALAGLELAALLVNCTDLAHLGAALPALRAAADAARPGLALGAYPHTGHHDPARGWVTHATDAAAFADALTRLAASFDLRIVGGCCGSTPAWIAELAARVHREPQARAAAGAALAAMGRPGSPARPRTA